MNKVLEYIIRAKDATGSAVSSALGKLKSFASGVGKNLANIQAGLQMLGNVAQTALGKLRKAFTFETMTIQFKTLIGSMDEARDHMAMLQKMGDTPPFSLEEFAAASRSMMVMTDGALGFEKSLQLVGDAAAATGQPIQNLAHEVGRAYATIRDGQPIARAVMGLRNMGAITPEVAARLDDLQKSGASNAEVWAEVEKALGKFKGSMEETEQTGDGLMGAISAQWDDAVRSFGGAVLETAKDGLQYLLAKMKQLNEDGTIEVWADRVGRAMEKAAEWVKDAIGWLGKLKSAYDWMRDSLEAVGASVGAAIGTWSEGGLHEDAMDAAASAWKDTRREQADRRADDASREEKIRAEAAKRRKEEEARAEKKKQTEEEKVARQMAEAQAKQDAKKAKEAEEAARKLAEEQAKKDAELREKEEAERMKLERKIHAERIRLQTAEVQAYEKEQTDAEKRLADAQAKVQQAWGWYRDKDSLAAQIAEEKADAEARKQYERDFDRLRDRRRDWRTATNLSLDDEAVRRVALAKEEEAAAQLAVKETAENTRRAAEALEAIEAAFDEGGE